MEWRGLRVLVVDDDPTWLRILEKMLKKCSYEGRGRMNMMVIQPMEVELLGNLEL